MKRRAPQAMYHVALQLRSRVASSALMLLLQLLGSIIAAHGISV
jgi:hypothetical protein